MPQEILRLRDSGKVSDLLIDVALNIVLGLNACVEGSGSLSFSFPTFAAETDVLVVPDSLLVQAADDSVLVPTKRLHPIPHALHHLSLYLRLRAVEIRVETRVVSANGKRQIKLRLTGMTRCLPPSDAR
jgi:hypothetical protein